MIVVVVLLIGTVMIAPKTVLSSVEITQPDYVNKVFDKNSITQININIDQTDWDTLLENATKEEYVNCDITINGETFSTVGIRAKGNSSLNMVASDPTTDRYSFKINFDKYVKGQSLYGLDKLALNNILGDATYMKEYLSYDMFAEMGVATPAFAFTSITVNGQPWGLYLAVEVIEESFLERYYGSTNGNLYKPESMEMGARGAGDMEPNLEQSRGMRGPGGMGGSGGTNLVYTDDNLSNYENIFNNAVLKSTKESDYQKVIDMIRNLNQGTDLEKYIDVDQVLRYFAVNTFLVNLDSYAGSMKHNYYLYEENGQFQILPWDFNLSFGTFQVQSAQSAINFPIDNPVTDTMENSPLISKLLEVDEYKELYHKHLNDLVLNYIKSDKYEATINRLDNLISDYVKNDTTAFYTYEEYNNSLLHLIQFGKDRAKSIMAQLAGQQPRATYGTLETTVDLKALGSMDGMGRADGKGQNNGSIPKLSQDDIPAWGPQDNMPNMPQGNSLNMNHMPQLLIVGASIVSILIGLLFVSQFNRRKYFSL